VPKILPFWVPGKIMPFEQTRREWRSEAVDEGMKTTLVHLESHLESYPIVTENPTARKFGDHGLYMMSQPVDGCPSLSHLGVRYTIPTVIGSQLRRVIDQRLSSIEHNKLSQNEEVSMSNKPHIVGSVNRDTRALSFSNTPKVHPNYQAAVAEATRLANSEPGKEFVVCELKETVVTANVVRKPFVI
jgi:hypothetical protein